VCAQKVFISGITKIHTDIKNQHMNLKSGDHYKIIHAAMHAGY